MILFVCPDPLCTQYELQRAWGYGYVQCLGELNVFHHERVESFFTTGNCLNRKLMEYNILFACGSVHQGDRHFSAESRGRQCIFISLAGLICPGDLSTRRNDREHVELADGWQNCCICGWPNSRCRKSVSRHVS